MIIMYYYVPKSDLAGKYNNAGYDFKEYVL